MTPQVITKIADKLREGAPFETACALAGVSRASGQAWLATARSRVGEAEKGEQEAIVGMPDSGWPRIPAGLFLAFLDAVEKARAEDEQRRIGRITQAAQGGAVVYERTEERVNEKTGAVRPVCA